MEIFETNKFKRLRKKVKEKGEIIKLKEAILKIIKEPLAGKKLKSEFLDLRAYRYFVKNQERRLLICKIEKDKMILLSFGPREGIYK